MIIYVWCVKVNDIDVVYRHIFTKVRCKNSQHFLWMFDKQLTKIFHNTIMTMLKDESKVM